ncbi:MAG: hypothetical protein IBJ11_07285 [Phycisphaerales bacterium]|nr:hypothetical protein [Phycisphaerales bacterium]
MTIRASLLAGVSVLVLLAGLAAGEPAASPKGATAPSAAEGAKKAAGGISAERAEKARRMLALSGAWLLKQQDEKSGMWSRSPEGQPQFPAITGLVVTGFAADPGWTEERSRSPEAAAAVDRGVAAILAMQKPDGGIYDRVLASYNTAICISALAAVGTPEARAAIEKAVPFLKRLQWSEDALENHPEVGRVGREHPFYGGVGSGRSARPDNSNLNIFVQALHDAGVSPQDEAFKRALVFLGRTQMLGTANEMPYAKGSTQGGFIYSTSESGEAAKMGIGQSYGGTIEETLSDGTVASRLRSYGSMTYAGFKSMLFADLRRDDARVAAAQGWIRRNYTLKENPGIGNDGLYYYYVTFARALRAWGEPTVSTLGGSPSERNWADDLVDRLGELQNADGSFKSVDERWMENNPVLITAYARIALREALGVSPSSQPAGK